MTRRIPLEVLAPEAGSLYASENKIYPRDVAGPLQNLRIAALAWLLGMFYVFPWLRWDGRQAVLFDLPARKFWHGAADLDTSVLFHGQRASSPLGPSTSKSRRMTLSVEVSTSIAPAYGCTKPTRSSVVSGRMSAGRRVRKSPSAYAA